MARASARDRAEIASGRASARDKREAGVTVSRHIRRRGSKKIRVKAHRRRKPRKKK